MLNDLMNVQQKGEVFKLLSSVKKARFETMSNLKKG